MSRIKKLAGLAEKLGVDAIMLTGEISLRYATKFKGLEGIVFVTAKGEGICFTDSRYIEAVTKQISPDGYQVVEPKGSYPSQETAKSFVQERGFKSLGFEDKTMSVSEYQTYRAILPCELVPIGSGLEELRRVKEPYEIDCIVRAQRIAEDSLNRLLPDIKPGAYEDELASKLRYYMGLGGSEGFAEGMILVCGPTTSMPHGQPSHKAISEGDFVTIDFGALVEGYFSDMTRTFGVGHVSQKMKDVYNIVLEAQLAGIDAFECGKTGKEVDAAARNLIAKAGYGDYFGHGLGHSLGLEIHEFPRANRTYEGRYQMYDVTTIEPGIYIPGEFGVRIEDMIYIDPQGKHNLANFPKELTIL